jgi:hypothetical protein
MAADRADKTGKMRQFFIYLTQIAQRSLKHCGLKLKPEAMPTQPCTLPAALHIAFVELRWLTVRLQGHLVNCITFGGLSVDH